jgi:hypothetical protein
MSAEEGAAMTAVTTLPVSDPDDGADGTPHRYTVGITGTGLSNGYLCLLYAVTPVPPPLRDDKSLHEGVDVALAIDQKQHVYRSGRSAYRTSASGSRVVGALRIGPAGWRGRGQVRVLFPPFAYTPGFEEILCEARVVIDAKRVRSTSIRGI